MMGLQWHIQIGIRHLRLPMGVAGTCFVRIFGIGNCCTPGAWDDSGDAAVLGPSSAICEQSATITG